MVFFFFHRFFLHSYVHLFILVIADLFKFFPHFRIIFIFICFTLFSLFVAIYIFNFFVIAICFIISSPCRKKKHTNEFKNYICTFQNHKTFLYFFYLSKRPFFPPLKY